MEVIYTPYTSYPQQTQKDDLDNIKKTFCYFVDYHGKDSSWWAKIRNPTVL